METRATKNESRKKLLLKRFLIVILVILSCGVAYSYYLVKNAETKLEQTYKPIENHEENKVIEATKPMSILLMGVDTGNSERTETWVGNSDSMLVMTINPKTKKTTITSLERDILTEIDYQGETIQAKLNAAYQMGGVDLAIPTIEKMLNMKFDHYLLINMNGLAKLVDAVGGIDVENKLGFPITIQDQEPDNQIVIGTGKQHLNGEGALVYSRMRYHDPEGDYGRQKRQREVIQAIISKMISFDSLGNYSEILEAVSTNIQTDIPLNSSNMMNLLGYKSSLNDIEQFQLEGDDATIAGISYQIAKADSLLEIQNRIREELGEDTVTKLKTNAVINGSTSHKDLDEPKSVNTDDDDSYFTYKKEE